MGYRREPIVVGEWYHCYNRGIDKRTVFESESDYERFLQALYLHNGEESSGRNNFEHFPHTRIFSIKRGKPIVAIGAYCLMPNHYHLLVREIIEGGIARFMHRVGTSYTMYFNLKNQRTGNLFNKPFRSRLVGREQHFRHLPQYIHLNIAEVFDPEWKKGTVRSTCVLEEKLRKYRFSSFMDYQKVKRPESVILDPVSVELLKEGMPSPRVLLEDAAAYYRSLSG